MQLGQADQPERLTVRMRDVSIGGANLIADRSFKAGQILSLELPADGELKVMLACVVRSTPLGEGQWSLGCAFSRELSTQDLEWFGAHKPQHSPEEQRTWVRHPCNLKATYQRIGEEDDQAYSAQVLNVSPSGVGLLLQDQVDPGSLMNLRLHNPNGDLVRTILACVVHSTQRANGELVVGCNFIRELAEDEVQSLLCKQPI